ncbi:MAG: hypothetical protein IPM92_09865 [Saprospiraceae bacterium]|nr:hypothetical protein [Saprospiraceae bacterium]
MWAFLVFIKSKNNGLIQINKDEFFKEIDIIILTFLENKFAENNFDYLYGGLGSGLYYFERLPSAIAYKSLERIVNLLDQTAEKNGDILLGQIIFHYG